MSGIGGSRRRLELETSPLHHCYAGLAPKLPTRNRLLESDVEASMHLVSFELLETLQHSARGRAARLGQQGQLGRQNRSGSRAGHAVTQLEPRRLGDEVLGFEALEPGRRGSQRIGAVLQSGPRAGWVVDLNRALAIKLACNDVGAPEPVADSLVPANMAGFLRAGASAVSAAHVALDFAIGALRDYDAPDILRAGAVEPVERLRLCAPIPRPGKIIGIDSNYPGALEREPTLFLKAPSSVIGCEDEILLPADGSSASSGGSLAIVIGSRARQVSATDALLHVAGYCVANDITASTSGTDDPAQFGKSHDTFCPLGPELITTDEVPEPNALALRTGVAPNTFTSANTKEMRVPIKELIARISNQLTLEPGDIILTGSPTNAPTPLKDGDITEVEIESLGTLRNYIRNQHPPTN
jgi:2-keto-4-pentenoate hydratase/2-oxohepta-3-ene-1,7-dioic acid hydratase in catechol pathway